MRRFELVEGTASKFWEVSVSDSSITTQWGRIGTNGQSKTKALASPAAAAAEETKLINEKVKKGYTEVGAGAAPTPSVATPPAQKSAPPATAPAPAAPSPAAAPPAPAAAVPEGIAPWLADGEPVDRTELLSWFAPTREYPPQQPVRTKEWTEHPIKREIVADLASTPPQLHHLVEALIAASDSATLTRDQAVAILLVPQLHGFRPEGRFAVVAKKFGLIEAVQMLLESYRIGIRQSFPTDGPAEMVICDDPEPYFGWRRNPLGANEEQLRAILATVDEDEYQQVVAVIRQAWPTIVGYRQAGLALALPGEPDLTEELITSHAAAKEPFVHWLQETAPTPELAAIAARVPTDDYSDFGTTTELVNALVIKRGVDAVDYLAPYADTDQTGAALSCIGTPPAIRALAAVATKSKTTLARLKAAVQRWPIAAAAGLAETACGDSRAATLAESTLSELLAQQPHLAELVTAWVSPAAAAVLTKVSSRANQVLDEAETDELPPVLASPPWLRPRTKQATLEIAVLPLEPTEQWPGGVRPELPQPYSWARAHDAENIDDVAHLLCRSFYSGDPVATAEARGAVAAAISDGEAEAVAVAYRNWAAVNRAGAQWSTGHEISAHTILSRAVDVLDGIKPGFALELWNALAGTADADDMVDYATKKHGIAALPGLTKVVQRRSEQITHAHPFGAVELAPSMARAYLKLKTARTEALHWIVSHPDHAAAGLIPAALGKAREARDCARAALQQLGRVEDGRYRAVIVDIARRYQRDDVLAAVEQMLDQDPTEQFPTKLSKLPYWWAPGSWTRPLLTSGRALPLAAVDHLGLMLMFPYVNDEPYAGIAQVTEACDRESLAEFGWDLFAAWLAGGAPSKDSWAMLSLASWGTDETARRITPYLRAWPGEGQHKRAVAGLAVLEGIGTDLALMQLNGIATKVKFKGLQDAAGVKISGIAEKRGLSVEELEDRLAPDLGLAADGTALLDFGARRFTVGFDEALRPYVRDDDGARLKDLPKPRQSDDPALATEATNRWKTLKKDARAVAAQQVLRLEVAMCVQRRWDLATFTTFLAGHPLVRHVVQRLLWATYGTDNRPESFFRVDETGQATDADDESITLLDDAIIGIPHALEIPADIGASFGQLFADYELLQPFDQLARASSELTPAELASTTLTRWADKVVPTGKILGLTNRGWRRGVPADGGVAGYIEKRLGGVSVVATLDPGLFTGYLDEAPEQHVTDVSVGVTNGWGDIAEPHQFSTLTPIVISELIRDFDGLQD